MEGSTIIGILVIVAAIILVIKASNSSPQVGGTPVSAVISHWSHFFNSFSLSANEFYAELEKSMQAHNMPNSVIGRTKRKEGGLLSASREYFRIKHGDIVFDVCAAPFGNDFFISWWLYETEGAMRSLFKSTQLGNFLQARASKRTFYQIDEEDMFRSCVHECILEVIEKVGQEKGIRELSDAEKTYKMGGM